MSSIASGALNLTVGLLWDKLRDHTAKRLQDGDVTDEKCRQMIVRELNDIASALDGLSRKDLLASVSFLKEGVCLLNIIVSQTEDGIKRYKKQGNDGSAFNQAQGEMAACVISNSGPNHALHKHFKESIQQLSSAATLLEQVSKERLIGARESFSNARCEATRAFNNKALSAKDRIMACKLRVVSRILENVEDPLASVETCMLYLEELHSLDAVREIFNVHIAAGLKSKFKKQKRQELMTSVIMVNYFVANFTLNFAVTKFNLIDWPSVQLIHRSLHPLLDPTAIAIMHKAEIGAPNKFLLDAIHSQNLEQQDHEMLVTGSGNIAQVTIRHDVMQISLFHNLDECKAERPKVLLVVTEGGEDSIYVVSYVQTTRGEFDFSLFVTDKSGLIRSESKLGFLSRAEKEYRQNAQTDEIEESFLNRPTRVELAVNSTMQTLIFAHQTNIYICTSNGALLHAFETTNRNDLVCLTNDSKIISAARFPNVIHVYSTDGTFLSQFSVGRGQKIYDVVSHGTSQLIYALTRSAKGVFQLEIYTQLGEHRKNLDLGGFNFVALFAMREGPVAVIYDKGFVLV